MQKALDRIQHPFIVKTLNKLGVEGIFLNLKKDILWKTHSYHYTLWGKRMLSPKIKNKIKMSPLSHYSEFTGGSSQNRKGGEKAADHNGIKEKSITGNRKSPNI